MVRDGIVRAEVIPLRGIKIREGAARAVRTAVTHRGLARHRDNTLAVGVVAVARREDVDTLGVKVPGKRAVRGRPAEQLAAAEDLHALCRSNTGSHLVHRCRERLARCRGERGLVEPDVVLIAVVAVGVGRRLIGKHAVDAAGRDGDRQRGGRIIRAVHEVILAPVCHCRIGRVEVFRASQAADVAIFADREDIVLAEALLQRLCDRAGGRDLQRAVDRADAVHARQADRDRRLEGLLRHMDAALAVGVQLVAGREHIVARMLKAADNLAVLIADAHHIAVCVDLDACLRHGGIALHLVDRDVKGRLGLGGNAALMDPDVVLVAVVLAGRVLLVGEDAVNCAVRDRDRQRRGRVIRAVDVVILTPELNARIGGVEIVRAGQAADVAIAADRERVVLAKALLQSLCHGLVRRRVKRAVHCADAVHAGQHDRDRRPDGRLVAARVRTVRAEDRHGGGDLLTGQLGEVVVIPCTGRNLLGILGKDGMLQHALNGDGRVVLRLRQHQILMGNDGRIAGLELVILLLTADGGIIRLISGHDASTMRVAVVIQPRQAAVLARNGLAEGVQALRHGVL